MAWKLLIGVMVILILAAAGLTFYGSQVTPTQTPVEQVVPNERLGN